MTMSHGHGLVTFSSPPTPLLIPKDERSAVNHQTRLSHSEYCPCRGAFPILDLGTSEFILGVS